MKQPPKPHVVRQKWKELHLLMESYKKRLESGNFNKSGRGTRAYYAKAIVRYTAYFEKWGHLLNVRLSTQPTDSLQRSK